jgi:DNA-binding transcriptional ArsR family regulator
MNAVKDIIKKTRKIVTAIYMVSDYMEVSEPLRNHLRNMSLKLLTDTEYLQKQITVQGHKNAADIKDDMENLIAILEMTEHLRMVSKMNADIIIRELRSMYMIIDHLPKIKGVESSVISGFSLPDSFFEKTETDNIQQLVSQENTETQPIAIKDKKILQPLIKKTVLPQQTGEERRNERKTKILALIKDKGANEGVMIKDISRAFVELSEKTIQRELFELVEKGQIKKMGEKRWSRYYLN